MKTISVSVSDNACKAARASADANPISATSAVEPCAEIIPGTKPSPGNSAAIDRIRKELSIQGRMAAKPTQNPPEKHSNSNPINRLRQNGVVLAHSRNLQIYTETVQFQSSSNRINNIQSTICTESAQKP